MAKKGKEDEKFRTSIPEPRWQQIVSVVIVIILLALWIYSIVKH